MLIDIIDIDIQLDLSYVHYPGSDDMETGSCASDDTFNITANLDSETEGKYIRRFGAVEGYNTINPSELGGGLFSIELLVISGPY